MSSEKTKKVALSLADSLPSDPTKAMVVVCERFHDLNVSEWKSHESHYQEYLGFYALLTSLAGPDDLNGQIKHLGSNVKENIQLIADTFKQVYKDIGDRVQAEITQQLAIDSHESHDGQYNYEFSDENYRRIARIIKRLQKQIPTQHWVDETSKQAFAKKLNQLHLQLSKTPTSLDIYWDLISKTASFFGNRAEETTDIVNTIKALAEIVWRTQADAEHPSSNNTFSMTGIWQKIQSEEAKRQERLKD